MNQPQLGKKILELRHIKGLTQGELAENCHLSLRTVQRIESAEVTPRSHTIKVIFSCLDYDFNNLSENLTDDTSGKDYPTKNGSGQFFKFLYELLNLKTNTMKKISFLSLVVILATTGILLTKNNLKAQNIEGWLLTGVNQDNYKIGLDKSVYKTGEHSMFLESKNKKIQGFATLMRIQSAKEYLGKRVKMTSYIKTEDVSEWAGMWLRIDSGQPREILSFDNMEDRPIKGDNEWTQYEIILDVPEKSSTLNYGVLLTGAGKVWFDDINFEIVDETNNPTAVGYLND